VEERPNCHWREWWLAVGLSGCAGGAGVCQPERQPPQNAPLIGRTSTCLSFTMVTTRIPAFLIQPAFRQLARWFLISWISLSDPCKCGVGMTPPGPIASDRCRGRLVMFTIGLNHGTVDISVRWRRGARPMPQPSSLQGRIHDVE
jgi:hypothetical protein